jgi:hypothetical protein
MMRVLHYERVRHLYCYFKSFSCSTNECFGEMGCLGTTQDKVMLMEEA